MTAKEYLQNTASRLTVADIDGVTTTLHFDFGGVRQRVKD
jgi:hypothetical protein